MTIVVSDTSPIRALEFVGPTGNQEVQRLRTTLDAGESEALVLAVELSAELILMDDRVGREAARRMCLRMVGTIGVLQRAKKAGLISAIRPLIEDIIDRLGFFLARELVDSVLKQEGEA